MALAPVQDTVYYKIVKALLVLFRAEFTPDGVTVKNIVNKYSIDVRGFAKQNTIVLQDDGITPNEEGHGNERRTVEILPATDPKTYKLVKNQESSDIAFRMRIFCGGQFALARSWLIANKLTRLASKITVVSSNGEEYNVFIKNEFAPDTIPNFSNITHLEGRVVIEAVEVSDIPSGLVYEAKVLKIESFEKGT